MRKPAAKGAKGKGKAASRCGLRLQVGHQLLMTQPLTGFLNCVVDNAEASDPRAGR